MSFNNKKMKMSKVSLIHSQVEAKKVNYLMYLQSFRAVEMKKYLKSKAFCLLSYFNNQTLPDMNTEIRIYFLFEFITLSLKWQK